jgi:hypothetical protein
LRFLKTQEQVVEGKERPAPAADYGLIDIVSEHSGQVREGREGRAKSKRTGRGKSYFLEGIQTVQKSGIFMLPRKGIFKVL